MKTLVSKLAAMLFALLCCCVTAAASAQSSTDTWVKVAPEGEKFSVLLPRSPTVQEERKSFKGLHVSGRSYRVQEGGSLYALWSLKLEAAPSDVKKDKAAYLDLCTELAWNMIIKPEIEAHFTPDYASGFAHERDLPSPTHPGRNYAFSIGKRRGATQIYLGDEQLYLVAVLPEADGISKPEKFMKSFSLGGKPLSDEQERLFFFGGRAVGPGSGLGPGPEGRGETPSSRRVDYNKTFTPREVWKKAHIFAKPQPLYTEEARRAGITGVVRLRLTLTASGKVSKITPLTRLPHGLTEQAIKAARGIKFEPALKDGRRVSQYVTIEYNFSY